MSGHKRACTFRMSSRWQEIKATNLKRIQITLTRRMLTLTVTEPLLHNFLPQLMIFLRNPMTSNKVLSLLARIISLLRLIKCQ